MFTTRTLPAGQYWILNRMKDLSLLNGQGSGVCYGLAATALLDILASGNPDEFNEILFAINDGAFNFKNNIKDVYQKYIELVQEVKKRVKAEIDASQDENYDKDTQTRKYINEGVDRWSHEERTKLKVQGMLESIELLQQPSQHADVLVGGMLNQFNLTALSAVSPKKILDEGGVVKNETLTGIYNQADLKQYFDEMQKAISQPPPIDYPFTIAIGNINHAITIGFIPDKGWLFVDANHLPIKFIQDSEALATTIMNSFEGDLCALQQTTFVTKKNSNDFMLRLNSFKESEGWKKISNPTGKVSLRDNYDCSWIIAAVMGGDIEAVKSLLDAKAEFNDNYLALAAQGGSLKLVKYLFEQGAKINAQAPGGESALIWASAYNQLEIVKFLLEKGADVNIENNAQATSLILAASFGHIEVVKLLLATKKNNNPVRISQALFYAASKGFADIVELLVSSGVVAIGNIYTSDRKSLIEVATEKNYVSIVKSLLTLTLKLDDCLKAMVKAAELGRLEIIKYLYEFIFKTNHLSLDTLIGNKTLLYSAAKNNQLEVVKFLIESGANPCVPEGKKNKSPLYIAAEKGNFNVVNYLLAHRANLEQTEENLCNRQFKR